MKWWKYPIFLSLGVAFGVLLTKAQLLSHIRIKRMFALAEPHLYLVIASAVATGLVSTLILKALRKKDIGGQDFSIKPRPMKFGIVAGGLIFGVGWYLTSACPGPVYALLGNGEWPAFFILGGAMTGAFLYSVLKPRLKD